MSIVQVLVAEDNHADIILIREALEHTVLSMRCELSATAQRRWTI